MTTALSRARAPYQRLVGPTLASPEAVVSHFGCMQSQDFAMAKWAIARRTGATNAELDDAFGAGRFLRTHILRPTWHFVTPEDLGWIMAVTAPRVHRLMATFNKTIDLHDAELDRAADIIVKALEGGAPLTRAQLAERLADSGLNASGTRLAHLFIHSELRALICNGPIAGKQHTYLLAPEAVTSAADLSQDEALARLARTYVRGHGPCQPSDLSWWSSLTLTQSRRAFELAGIETRTIDGQEFWCDESVAEEHPLPRAALIPAFDECISYVAKPIDVSRFPGNLPDLARGGGLLFIDGLIGGAWGRTIKSKFVEIDVRIHGPLPRVIARAIETEAERYAAFLDTDMVLNITA